MNAWIVETLVSSSLLMLFVLASRRLVGAWFGARVAYALWLLPALRMVLPPLPGHHALFRPVMVLAPAADVRVGIAPPASVADPLVLPADVAASFDPAPVATGMSWPAMFVTLWLVGAVLFFGWQMLRYRRFVGRALDGATHLSTSCGVEVFASDGVEGPIASGVLRRRIFLPRDFLDRYSSSERRQALLHEGAHHDRRDLLANVVAIGLVAIHWWNPLAHFAYRAFRADQELACDATVLADAAPDELYAYGSALVKSTVGRAPAAACAFNRTDEIKRRLMMIKRGRIALPLRVAGAALAVGAVAGGLVVTASGSTAAVRLQATDLPVADTVPAPQGAKISTVPAPVRALPAQTLATPSRSPVSVAMAGEPPVPPVPPVPAVRPSPVAAPLPPMALLPPVAPRAPLPPLPPVPPVAIRLSGERLAAAEEARAEAGRARAEAGRARAEAARMRAEASRVRDEARAAADMARTQANVARIDAQRLVAASLAGARANMIATCAAHGTPVSADERDWGKLAVCDKAAFNARVIAAMEQARRAIERSRDENGAQADHAISALDRAIERMRDRSAS